MFLSDIIRIIGCEIFVKDKKVKGIKIDSRDLNKGDLFICINKGHDYIEEAIKREVCAIIVSKDVTYNTDIPIIKVEDTIITLGLIASYIRTKYEGVVIAITGSNGKTTTKELLSYVLSKRVKVLKNNGTENNHIGVPKTILSLNNSYDYLVLEFGTNHPGEIAYLTKIVKPDIAIITNIGSAHIGNFGNIDNILKEKLSIKSDNTILFINGEDLLLSNTDGIKVYKEDYDFIAPVPLYQMNYNLVFRVCEYLGFNIKEVYDLIKDFDNIDSRMEKSVVNNITVIDDSYNASFESVIGGLNSLTDYNRKIIILGDMLELGDYSKYLHAKIGQEIDKMDNTILLTIGEETKYIEKGIHFTDTDTLLEYLNKFKFIDKDVIYIKGAHKMGLYKIVTIIKQILKS